MSKIYNWGIIGLNDISQKFAEDLDLLENAKLHAVASRSLTLSKSFAKEFQAPHFFGTYEEMIELEDLDVIFIATPHVSHFSNTIMCLNAGIPVLCEKPFAMNARELEEMIETARRNQVFLMEGLYTRFLPPIKKAFQLIKDGMIGEVLSLKADLGIKADEVSSKNLFDKNMGGGSLLDVGIYPVFLSLLLFGKPNVIKAVASKRENGIDESCAILLQYQQEKLAMLNSSIVHDSASEAFIYGKKGTIRINTKWNEQTSLSLMRKGEITRDYFFDYNSNGYLFEAKEVMRSLDNEALQSPFLSWDFSLVLMKLMDSIRMEAGIHYPQHDKYPKGISNTNIQFSLN